MPEGDTLFRTAATIRRWLGGRAVTAASTTVAGLPADRLVGQTVESVDAWGKHLLVRFDSGQVLHTHMRMSGSWHVYPEGDPWRRPARQARLVLTCGGRTAVCFNAPVVELLAARADQVHPALAGLGPDVLADPVDVDEIRRRARRRPPGTTLGELLLDQRVVAGIGNIWRNEALFVSGHNPWTALGDVTDAELDTLVTTASTLMRDSAGLSGPNAVTGLRGPNAVTGLRGPNAVTGLRGHPGPRWVYGRQGRPCRRCGTPVVAGRQGEQARTAYWCPACQPQPAPPASSP